MGYEKVGLWGISKGAELALVAGSLLPQIKFFKGDRGKNKEGGHNARMDSLEKTLEFVSRW